MATATTTDYGVEAAGQQLRACLEDLPADFLTAWLTPAAKTGRDLLEHLAESYQAAIAEADGGAHEWGSFHLKETEVKEMVERVHQFRDEARKRLSEKEDPAADRIAMDYLVLHDAYHIGQIVLTRLSVQPNWNPDAIYG